VSSDFLICACLSYELFPLNRHILEQLSAQFDNVVDEVKVEVDQQLLRHI
jgi:hypothetical protein